MKVSNEDKVLIGVGAVAVLGLGYLYWRKKQNENQAAELPDYIPENTPSATPKAIGTSTGIDRNKLLGKGSKGLEVRELQRLLNVKVDGDFGNITLTALQKAKGVSQISLNQFQIIKAIATPVAKTVAPVVTILSTPNPGTKLMVSVPKTSLYNAKKLANGAYSNTNEKLWAGGNLVYGDSAGIFKKATANGSFLVQKDGDFYFVNGKHVKPY